tara:strand:+ start:291 stop:2945 length:2655 start_codon:yes stop_codon:yes gene_type:complete
MPKTVTSQVNDNRFLDAVNLVWLVEATFDQFGVSTITKRYGSRAITISSNAYEDSIAANGLELGMNTVATRGGLAAIASLSLKLRDEEAISELADTYILQNDEMVFYVAFIDGSQSTANNVEIARGIIETHSAANNVWNIRLKDASKTQLIAIPSKLVEPTRYPNAYEFGQVVPIAFGNLNVGPTDGAGVAVALAPVRMTDTFELQGTAGFYNTTNSTAYQWYAQTSAFAEIIGTSQSAEVLTLADPSRKMILRPTRPKTSNDITGWKAVADGDTSAGVAVGAGQDLDLYLGGSPKLGELTALSVVITATGSYTLTVKDDTTTLSGPTSVSGSQTVTLTAANYAAWDLSLLNIEIDGSADAVIKQIELDVRFSDFLAFQEAAPSIFQKITGFKDVTGNYRDGNIITSSSGSVLRNPVNILEAILRNPDMMNLVEASIKNGWADATTSRANYKFDFVLNRAVETAFLGEFCMQAGLHLYPEEGGWSVAALDKTRAPSHFWWGDYHMPVRNGLRDPSQWQYDFKIDPAPISDVINEVAFRYKKSPSVDEYKAVKIASGQYRFSANCTIVSAGATGTLTDTSGVFVSKSVIVGEHVYVEGQREYKVDNVVDAQNLTISPADGTGTVIDAYLSTKYYLGPNINAEALLSQLAYKTVQALGTRQRVSTDDGGYKSNLVQDDATATLIVDHLMEWFSQPRDRLEFSLFHSAIDVQLGDIAYIDHPRMRTSKRPVSLTTINGAHTNSDTTVAVANAGIFRENDYIYVVSTTTKAPEAMKVTSINTSTNVLTVTRGTLNTVGQALAGGETVRRCELKWMVTGVKPFTPNSPYIRVRVEQMPPSYLPGGIVVAAGSPTYASSTPEQITQSGYSTHHNGRVIDEQADSNVSYVS